MTEIIESTLEVLSPMEELTKFDMVCRVEGSLTVIQNIPQFKEHAAIALSKINRILVTDDDFDRAAMDIKYCKQVEDNLSAMLDVLINSNSSIAESRQAIESTKPDFSELRKSLTNLVKERKTNRKNEIISAGSKRITDLMAISPVNGHYKCDRQAIVDATKNKRLFSVMEEAVALVVDKQIAELEDLEATYLCNIKLLEASLLKFPGIHPDKNDLAVKPTELLEQIIGQREATQTLLLKEQAEKAAADKKVEEERVAKEKADKEEADHLVKIEADRLAEEQRNLIAAIPEPIKEESEETIQPPPPVWTEPEIAPDPFSEVTFGKEGPPPLVYDEAFSKKIMSFNNIPPEWKELYHKVNRMMLRLGADGEINATQKEAGDVMDALFGIDGGQYNERM